MKSRSIIIILPQLFNLQDLTFYNRNDQNLLYSKTIWFESHIIPPCEYLNPPHLHLQSLIDRWLHDGLVLKVYLLDFPRL